MWKGPGAERRVVACRAAAGTTLLSGRPSREQVFDTEMWSRSKSAGPLGGPSSTRPAPPASPSTPSAKPVQIVHTFPQPVPIVARIVWADDGEEQFDTVALG